MQNKEKEKLKILVIGDVHQSNFWERFNFNKYDKICFLGDYFDDFSSDWNKLNPIENLQKILYLQQQDKDKFHILLGNHDFQYLDLNEEYSGKQKHKQYDIHEFLEEHIKEFRLVYKLGNILFSHAGVSSIWCEDYQLKDIETINSLLWNKIYGALSFYPYDTSWTGRNPHQSPIWIRPEALCMYPWKNYTQIVGHTSNLGPNGVARIKMKNDKSLFVVDNKEHTAYLELEIEKDIEIECNIPFEIPM